MCGNYQSKLEYNDYVLDCMRFGFGTLIMTTTFTRQLG